MSKVSLFDKRSGRSKPVHTRYAAILVKLKPDRYSIGLAPAPTIPQKETKAPNVEVAASGDANSPDIDVLATAAAAVGIGTDDIESESADAIAADAPETVEALLESIATAAGEAPPAELATVSTDPPAEPAKSAKPKKAKEPKAKAKSA